jgi:hypothetical protein
VIAAYFATVVAYELFAPWWAGDQIGIGPAALLLGYGPTCLVWLAIANACFGLARLCERLMKPLTVPAYRRRAFAGVTGFATAFPALFLGGAVVEALLRRR